MKELHIFAILFIYSFLSIISSALAVSCVTTYIPVKNKKTSSSGTTTTTTTTTTGDSSTTGSSTTDNPVTTTYTNPIYSPYLFFTVLTLLLSCILFIFSGYNIYSLLNETM